MRRVSSQQLNQEIKQLQLLDSFEGISLPFNGLDDRSFEVLNYQIFKEKISKNFNYITERFDCVDLMEGVGEKGRDCVLMLDQKNVGLVQCKKVATNITKPQFVKELLKFLLFSLIDKSLISDRNNFTYFFSVSTGLAGSTKQLIREFNTKILEEKDLKDWCEKIISGYKSLEHLKYDKVESELYEILSSIKIERILPQDLEGDLGLFPQISKHFFKLRTVIDTSEIRDICKKYLDPILSKIYNDEKKGLSLQTDFKEYLERSFKENSVARTLVFGNQQKRLEEFYYPLELTSNHITVKTDRFPKNLLPIYQKVLIVDNGGMGKSTILKWLFMCTIKEKKGIPIFIELRRLSKDNSIIDEILSQINSLNKRFDKQFLLDLIDQGNFIFFLDGYDEIKNSDKSDVTKGIGNFVSKASKNHFVLTSRPENIDGVFGGFRTFQIKKLIPTEAYKLIERIGNYNQRSLALIKKLKDSDQKNLKEFLTNPLLISLLYKKFEYRESIPLQKQEFYYEVFEALFKAHDITKGTDYFIRPKKTGLNFTQFFQLLRSLGYKSIQINELEFNKSVLEKLISECKEELSNIDFIIDDFIDDLTVAVPLFYKEGLLYRWSHKSIMEYFAAEFICIDTKGEQGNVLYAIYSGKRFTNLFHVMDLCYDIDYKTFRNSVIYPFCKSLKSYYDSTFKQIDSQIEISDIRFRQYRMYIEETYLIKSDETIRTTKEAKKTLGNGISGIKFIPRFSQDNYYVGSVRQKDKERKLVQLIREKKHPLIKETELRDFNYSNKHGAFSKSGVSIFQGEINDPKIRLSDDPTSPENNPKYFKNVSLFLRGSAVNHDEVDNIIEESENDLKLKKDKSLTKGF